MLKYLHTIAIVAIFSAAQAQTGAQVLESILPEMRLPRTIANPHRARLIAKSQYRYDGVAQSYSHYDTSHYTYTGGRGGTYTWDVVQPDGYDTLHYLGIANNYEYNVVTTYDANNNGIRYTPWMPEIPNAPLQECPGTHCIYDANGRLLTDSTWHKPGTVWIPFEVYHYKYDAAGRMTGKDIIAYDQNTSSFSIEYDLQYTFDAMGNITTELYRVNNSGTWANTARTLYIYNTANVLTSRKKQSWNTSQWSDEDSTVITLNSNNLPVSIYAVKYDRWQASWDTTRVDHYTYDVNGNVTEQIMQQRSMGFPMPLQNARKYINTYDVNNYLISTTTSSWENGQWDTINGDIIYNYYWEDFTPTTIAQLPQQGGTLQLYPVPANNTLNITINWKEAQPYTLTIADMQGRVTMQYNSSNANETIDVSTLPAGVYNIILKGDKGGVQHSKFSVVR